MAQKKLHRFAAIETYPNVLQYPEGMAGNWKAHFKNENPITLELACGKGEYSVGLGRVHPERNFIGMDVKGNRIYIGAKKSLEEGLDNVAFVRTQIGLLPNYFEKNEVEEIWIIFPDPFLKKEKNRLTHPTFLALYQKVLKHDGIIHLKTDSPELYEFTCDIVKKYHCQVIENVQDIHAKGMTKDGPLSIRTHYEGLHLEDGRCIYYISFKLPKDIIVPPVKQKKSEQDEIVIDSNLQDGGR